MAGDTCGRGHAWQGACMTEGVHGMGVCVAGGVRGRRGCN